MPTKDSFTLVQHFNREVLSIKSRSLGFQERDEFELSMRQLQEEINEISDAFAESDFIGLIDGLIDLEYFLLGVLYKNGVDCDMHSEIFEAVHNCNMQKVKGIKAGREGFNAIDAVKPEDWVSPEERISDILSKRR